MLKIKIIAVFIALTIFVVLFVLVLGTTVKGKESIKVNVLSPEEPFRSHQLLEAYDKVYLEVCVLGRGELNSSWKDTVEYNLKNGLVSKLNAKEIEYGVPKIQNEQNVLHLKCNANIGKVFPRLHREFRISWQDLTSAELVFYNISKNEKVVSIEYSKKNFGDSSYWEERVLEKLSDELIPK